MVFIITLADSSQTVSSIGKWLKTHHGPDFTIIMIFFVSGILLEADQIVSGLKDISGTLTALFIIFLVAPLAACLMNLSLNDTGMAIGIFLVAVMPSTLSSGVVMTGAAGGNMAHSLFITILANSLAVFTIPISLSLLLKLTGGSIDIVIDKTAIMIKLGLFVMVPLFFGIIAKRLAGIWFKRFSFKLNRLNQCMILMIVWMAVSQAREVIISSGKMTGNILLLVFVFHGVLLLAAGFLVWCFKFRKGRRESIIFMGSQKTLPLSIILQVSLFPQYGIALVVCVMHHIVHLLMDGYLVGRLKGGKGGKRL